MLATSNAQILVDAIASGGALDGRYKILRCVNYPPAPGAQKRGCFSIIFEATDSLLGDKVAIKFMDPDGSVMPSPYRLESFLREPEILDKLRGKNRCLQIVEKTKDYPLRVAGSSGITLPCQYFTTEWLEEDVDSYFLDQSRYQAKEKLSVFKSVVLAVEAIHGNEVFHRDLKYDNLRFKVENSSKVVVVIDFGTAASVDSGHLRGDYKEYNVGAPAYSAPEAFLGFAGDRDLGPLSDAYALGCLLYEMFNDQYLFPTLFYRPEYQAAFLQLRMQFLSVTDYDKRMEIWSQAVPPLAKMLAPPTFLGPKCTIPPGIATYVDKIFRRLVQFDFRNRSCRLALLRRDIDRAINVIESTEIEQHRIERMRVKREWRKRKALEKEQRLTEAIRERALPQC